MAKVIEARGLRGERRESLVDAVPLDAPWTVFIEPTNACNLRCAYCPTGKPELLREVGRKITAMPMDLFTKVVDDLKAFGKPMKMVNLYKDGEPLAHPRFAEMVRYLKAANVTEKIWTKTNGVLLNPIRNAELVECGLDMIGISVQGPGKTYFGELAGVDIDYDKYIDNIRDLYQRSRGKVEISIKTIDNGLSEDEKGWFFDDFGGICDYIAIEGLHGWSASEMADFTLGNRKSFDGTPRVEKVACPLVLYMLSISANGDASICNDDWGHWHQLGNVRDESVSDIWRGEKLRSFRELHLEGRREENRACKGCDYVNCLPDNIDDHREMLLGRLNAHS